MARLLFVDDEPNVLQGLQRMLRPMRNEWQMSFADNGPAALAKLATEEFDIVISDMRMPGMNGAQLLAEVRKAYPHVVRIILSGQSDQEALLRAVGPSHQYLSKPCDADMLKSVIFRVCALRQSLAHDSLQRLTTQMEMIPSLPATYTEMLEALESPDITLQKLGEIIARDIGMTAKLLQLVNSAYFGVPQRVTCAVQAINLIGLETVKALVLSSQIFSSFELQHGGNFSITDLHEHCWSVARMAKQIAQVQGQSTVVMNDAFTAGLLHDIGRLALATTFPEDYERLLEDTRRNGRSFKEAEQEIFGVTHSEVGAYLLGLWGLPDTIVESLAFHHTPSQTSGREFSPLTAVHVANVFDQERRQSQGKTNLLDDAYLSELGLTDQVANWRTACEAIAA